MNCNAAETALPFPASASVGAATESPLAKLRALWQGHVERTSRARAGAAFSSIDSHTLRDIGAPDWVLAEAALRNDSRGLRLIDLYRS